MPPTRWQVALCENSDHSDDHGVVVGQGQVAESEVTPVSPSSNSIDIAPQAKGTEILGNDYVKLASWWW